MGSLQRGKRAVLESRSTNIAHTPYTENVILGGTYDYVCTNQAIYSKPRHPPYAHSLSKNLWVNLRPYRMISMLGYPAHLRIWHVSLSLPLRDARAFMSACKQGLMLI